MGGAVCENGELTFFRFRILCPSTVSLGKRVMDAGSTKYSACVSSPSRQYAIYWSELEFKGTSMGSLEAVCLVWSSCVHRMDSSWERRMRPLGIRRSQYPQMRRQCRKVTCVFAACNLRADKSENHSRKQAHAPGVTTLSNEQVLQVGCGCLVAVLVPSGIWLDG